MRYAMRVLFGLVVWLGLGLGLGALAQTVSILPNAMTQFSDGNGAPYAGGHVYMYVPYTTTPKATYQDPLARSANQNPIPLDPNGRAVIWGSGEYRQVLQDLNGNVVWDQLTYASPIGTVGQGILWYGTALGTANAITLTGTSFTGLDGQEVAFIASSTNTAGVTMNVGGFGSTLTEINTATGLLVMTSGQLVQGNLYYATYSAKSNVWVVTNPTLIGSTSVPVSELVGVVRPANLPNGAVSPLSFGAVCDGVTDDTGAFQSAITAMTGGGLLEVPVGTCAIAGSLVVTKNVVIEGTGITSSMLLFTGSGVADGIDFGSGGTVAQCVGSTPPAACAAVNGEGIRNIGINVPSRVGGFAVSLNGTFNFFLDQIYVASSWDMLNVVNSNTPVISNMNGYTRDTSGASISLAMTITSGATAGWYVDIAPTFFNVIVNAQNVNANGSCMNIDGPIYTPILYSVHLLNCGIGLVVSNSARSGTIFPEFLQAYDLEIDGSTNQGLVINAGVQSNVFGCDVDVTFASGVGHYPLLMNTDYGFSFTRGWTFTGCQFHVAPGPAAYIEGNGVNFANCQFYDSNKIVSGTYPVVDIEAANTDNIQITGSFIGQRYGDSATGNYGVLVGSSVTGAVSLVGNDYTAATLGSVDNSTNHTIGLTGGIGYTHGPITSVNCAATTVCN